MSSAADTWLDANRRYLAAALAEPRSLLVRGERLKTPGDVVQALDAGPTDLAVLAAAMSPPPALEVLCADFGLSSFERGILLLCAGVELDPAFAPLCGAVQGGEGSSCVTFALALDVLPDAHWTALAPSSPLRRWRLIDVGPGPTLTHSPLRIEERALHYLTGVNAPDEQLSGLLDAVPQLPDLPPTHRELAQRATLAWAGAADRSTLPALLLAGSDRQAQRAIAAAACALLGLNLHALSVHAVPTTANDLDNLQRLWEREAMMCHSALLLEGADSDVPNAAHDQAVQRLIDRTCGAIVLAGGRQWPAGQRPVIRLDVDKPRTAEQLALWQSLLGPLATRLNGQIEQIVGQFDLDSTAIRSACEETLFDVQGDDEAGIEAESSDADALKAKLWDRCRAQARSFLDDLAQRIEPAACWDDLVIPASQRDILRDMAMHVRQQRKVYGTWGFASKGKRGLGVSALFAGASGTGKTMAAEVLADELSLDLYRIDLSAVVSKYIGETEKNLRRIFDAAESGGVILLFDEADALFGKRSEVKDSHDRHANIEVSYLLQRMEAYRGLAILTTNMKEALDSAFLRRIRFVVQFPFPDWEQRLEIWRRVFPEATPTEQLDVARLAQLHITGGNIRNIALHGAFAAAEEGGPVRMAHLLRAARGEYLKLEKPLTDNETRGWLT